MPELVEQMYCSQQIVIPPKFPYILKRYCKAAIKTQPYDLLRWSYEYFKALGERRAPPVKLRLEYPVFSTEGGLTRGCLKVLANQLAGMSSVPLPVVKSAWQGFCLDPIELRRIFCLCEVYMRAESVMFLHFIAVAGGLLTKSLTHTMILLCETLTKEPDGGSAGIPVEEFLIMYKFLAKIDASKDTKYINGYKEGMQPVEEEDLVEEEPQQIDVSSDMGSDDYWQDAVGGLQKIALINDQVAKSARLSLKMAQPLIGKIERSPSVERASAIDRDNYLRDRKGIPTQSGEINDALQQLSAAKFGDEVDQEDIPKKKDKEDLLEEPKDTFEINVLDEDENPVAWEIYGGPFDVQNEDDNGDDDYIAAQSVKSGVTSAKSMVKAETESNIDAKSKSMQSTIETKKESFENEVTESQKIQLYVANCYQERDDRREDLMKTFEEIVSIVDRFKSVNYDLGMVAGRQMSTTSGEFIVQQIEKEIMDYIDEQIAILPDPDLKKKKAKPEEVVMIRDLLAQFLDENIETIVPDEEEVEEEEEPIPDVLTVYAVPGIGASVDEEIIKEFEDYALEACKIQADVFMPRNIRHFMCPPLEKYEEYCYDECNKEQVPTGGVITD